jgi:disulfide bond formation protein DsbB
LVRDRYSHLVSEPCHSWLSELRDTVVVMSEHIRRIVGKYRHLLPYLVWGVALAAMVGSLVLSDVMHLIPCVLCWWQRIFMYPLVVIVGVSILRRDEGWVYTALPMAAVGFAMATYHSLLQWGVIPAEISPCNAVVSCVTKQLSLFGFVTIPFVSALSFAAITIASVLYIKSRPR